MKRLFQSLKLKKAKEKILEQSKEIRVQLEEEHGDKFKEFQQQAITAHTGQAPQNQQQDEKLDPTKNLETILKFMTTKSDKSDDFQKQILKMVKDKQTGKFK